MKVVHWNTSRVNSPMSGIKKYEDELFKNLVKIARDEGLDFELEGSNLCWIASREASK
jgi:hypothetical protein